MRFAIATLPCVHVGPGDIGDCGGAMMPVSAWDRCHNWNHSIGWSFHYYHTSDVPEKEVSTYVTSM